MGVSSISGASMQNSLAIQATAQKGLQVQDKIIVSVIKQTQNQQKMLAEALLKMMDTGRVDIRV